MSRQRLDTALTRTGQIASRSQAESYIKLGKVKVDSQTITKPGYMVMPGQKIELEGGETYVSRAGLKLASVADKLNLHFTGKIVLDVGSSTGGFTDYALKHGAKKVIAVDVGSEQLHPSLRGNERIELHEKTDIRNFNTAEDIDITVIDVSFISLRQVLPAAAKLSNPETQIIAMLKPQFEAGERDVNKGIIKNDTIRRKILKDFEAWARERFVVIDKADSEVAGAKGNQEKFYLLKVLRK